VRPRVHRRKQHKSLGRAMVAAGISVGMMGDRYGEVMAAFPGTYEGKPVLFYRVKLDRSGKDVLLPDTLVKLV
jgi:hypothetical protein